MKPGHKIYAKLAPATCAAAIRKLSNGNLRSLLHYTAHAGSAHAATDDGEMITATAMCEVVIRFMAKGKGKLL